MKVKCLYCGRIYNDPTQACPGCGAFNEALPEPVVSKPRPIPQNMPVHTPTKTQNHAIAVILVTVIIVSILLIGVFSYNANTQNITNNTNMTIISDEIDTTELYKSLEENPTNFDIVVELTTALYSHGKQSEAQSVAMTLFSKHCEDISIYHNIADIMQQYNDISYACRMYLCAYQLSNDDIDLASATECGTPGELMKNGPTVQALELFFQNPISMITWEDIGKIQYFSPHYDYIEMSLDNPTDLEYSFTDTIQSFRIDRSEDSSYTYLYGLCRLDIYTSTQFRDVNLFALQKLRSLYISNLTNSSNMGIISNLPQLEILHVGGSDITSLDGLDKLPQLHTFSLTGTSIESLSALASYHNIKTLSLKNNDKLTGLSSLEIMGHIEGLHIEDQAVFDFRFLDKMSALKELSIIDTSIKDISFLSKLGNLEALTIYDNDDLKNISTVGSLSNLRRLSITANKFNVTGVEEIANLTSLEWLRLYNPTSISMISTLTSLKTLELSSISILDSFAPIAGLTNLETFRVDTHTGGFASFDGSLSPLASLPKLKHVSIPGYALYHGKALFDVKTLTYLDLTGCRLEFASNGFSKLKNLKTLKLSGTKWISNVQIWSDGGITNYNWDNVASDNAISTIVGLSTLEHLELAKTELVDISFIPSLTKLIYVDLADNYITNIAPLGNTQTLRQVNLSGNPVQDWSPAENWTHVHVIR